MNEYSNRRLMGGMSALLAGAALMFALPASAQSAGATHEATGLPYCTAKMKDRCIQRSDARKNRGSYMAQAQTGSSGQSDQSGQPTTGMGGPDAATGADRSTTGTGTGADSPPGMGTGTGTSPGMGTGTGTGTGTGMTSPSPAPGTTPPPLNNPGGATLPDSPSGTTTPDANPTPGASPEVNPDTSTSPPST